MKISEILKDNKVHISCELFPPKSGMPMTDAYEVVRKMATLSPSFMSVTYGAAGTESGRTADLADEIQNKNGITALAHLTCVTADKEKIKQVLGDLAARGIENILALRGDIPQNCDFPASDQFHHASDLIYEIKRHGDFCIGGACYPEKHPDSENSEQDLCHIKEKVDAGCSFLTTQMFFDNNILYHYLFRLLQKGVDVPVIAGIMPVTNAKQITRICALCGASLPPRFRAIVDRFADNPKAMKQAGIAYATEQIIDLVANGVHNIHIYTMNNPDIAGKIMDNLSEVIA